MPISNTILPPNTPQDTPSPAWRGHGSPDQYRELVDLAKQLANENEELYNALKLLTLWSGLFIKAELALPGPFARGSLWREFLIAHAKAVTALEKSSSTSPEAKS